MATTAPHPTKRRRSLCQPACLGGDPCSSCGWTRAEREAEERTLATSAARPQDSARNSVRDDHLPLVIGLAPDRIRPNPRNPRRHFDEAALAELAASIRQHGVLEPILVRPLSDDDPAHEDYELIAGERRWRAALLAERAEIPCRVLEGLSDDEALKLTLIENLQRQDLDPVEEAEGYRALADTGLRQAEIAAAVHRSQPSVANRLRLLKLPDGVRERIRRGELTAAHGVALARFEKFPKVVELLADDAVQHGRTSKDLERGIPQAYALTSAGAAVVVREWEAKFKLAEHCYKCPFGAYQNGLCLKPEHYQQLQDLALVERQAKAKAAIQEAEQAGTLLQERTLNPGDYREVREDVRPDHWAAPPTGCSAACECRHTLVGRDGEPLTVCTNVAKIEELRRLDAKRAAAQRKQALAADLERLHSALAGTLVGDARALAIIAAHICGSTNMDVLRPLWERYGLPVPMPKGSAEARELYAQLAERPPGALLKLTLGVILAAELQMHHGYGGYYQPGGSPCAHWYAGIGAPAPERQAPENLSVVPMEDHETEEKYLERLGAADCVECGDTYRTSDLVEGRCPPCNAGYAPEICEACGETECYGTCSAALLGEVADDE